MSATSGKVALVTAATALACGANCHAAAGVKDFVGYGSANDFETLAAPTLSNTTAALRGDGPDTDDNAADFTAGAPTPRNTGVPPDPGVPGLRIHDIQGAAQVSPRVGVKVADVPGVVTTVSRNGFWFQDPAPDADPATSEGLFVFTGTAPTAAAGDAVTHTLTASGGLVELPRTLPVQERYTYVFEGNSEVLDHILLSPPQAFARPSCSCNALFEYDPVHLNSEFNDQVSDHDPQVVRLTRTS